MRHTRKRKRVAVAIATAAACVLTLAGCSSIPADADDTLSSVQGGEMHVGVTHNPPWTDASGAQPTGHEVRLVEKFAESLDSDIIWTVGSEADLVEQLHTHSLDLVVGGFTDDTPWTDKAAMTVPFDDEDVAGTTKKHVMLTVLGENDFLTTLETFLLERGEKR